MGFIVDAGNTVKFSVADGESITISTRQTAIAIAISGLGLSSASPVATVNNSTSTFGPFSAGVVSVLALGEAATVATANPSVTTGSTLTGSNVVGGTLTAKLPAGTVGTIQFTRTTKTVPPVRTAIAGAVANSVNSLNYVVQASDANYTIGFDVSARVNSIFGYDVPALDGPIASLRQVASGTHLSNYISTANKYIGVTSEHTLADSVSAFKLVYANFRIATGEVDGAAMTASVGVEYPAGVFTRVNFGGSALGAIAAGAVIESDMIALSIPAGAKFKVHAKLGWPSGFFIATSDMSYHASTRFSAGATDGDVPDYSLGGGEWNAPAVNTTSYVHTPVAIVAMSAKPCVGLLGSSTPRGFGDLSITDYGITGYLSRAISPTNAVMNIAVSGDSFTNSQSSRAKRLALLKYVTHVVASIGTNDIYGTPAWNSTQVVNAYTALVAAIDPTKKTWLGLYQPRNTGTWTSQGGQSINSTFEGYRVAVNNAVKAGIAGAAGYVDGLSASESNVNPENGLWRTDLGASTIDGIHMNSACAIRAAALVPVSTIVNS